MANRTGNGQFVKGDRRINRDGRPANSGDLAALCRRIGHEIATTKDGKPVIGPDGRPMTVIEAIVRQRAQDKRYQGEFIDRGWGKVPNPVTLQGDKDNPIETRQTYELSGLDVDELKQLAAIIAKLGGDQS